MGLYFEILLKSHLVLSIFIFLTFIIELVSGKYIFVLWFKFKKDLQSAKGTADREAVLYFLYHLLYAVYFRLFENESIQDLNFLYWILIIFILSIIFRLIYYKYQGKDPRKPSYGGLFDDN
jgi:hypothetical protein